MGGRKLAAVLDACQYPAHVRVQHQVALTVAKGGDGSGGVLPDTRKGPQGVKGGGDLAAVLRDDHGRGGVEPLRAAGVAQPTPGADGFAGFVGGER